MKCDWNGVSISNSLSVICIVCVKFLTRYFVLLKIGVLTVQDKIYLKEILTKNTINECFHLDAIILFNKAKNRLKQKNKIMLLFCI